MAIKTFYSHGKLLLTGEYAVLDGALALAIPTKFGQHLSILPNAERQLYWESFTPDGRIWFEASLFQTSEHSDNVRKTLEKILETAMLLNPRFIQQTQGVRVQTHLEFERNWGLGSSSTLISNIAQWSGVNAFELLFLSFGGSGYDIACALNDTPILYQLKENTPLVYPIEFSPNFTEQIYFVHLQQKQDSKQGIALYHSVRKRKDNFVRKISEITQEFIRVEDVETLGELIDEHENVVANFLKLPKVKDLFFSDFAGSIKSLGAWGGDFAMVVSDLPLSVVKDYFKNKGFPITIPYSSMIF